MTAQILCAVAILATAAIKDVDLVTATDTGFALTFVSDRPAEAEIAYGRDPDRLDQTLAEPGGPLVFHYLEVTGLEPGVTYYYRIAAGNSRHPRPPLPPARVTTLVPPEGPYLFSFAVINDLHVGEDVAGLIILPGKWGPVLTNGFTWKNPVDNYWSFTLNAVVAAINRTDAVFTVANGDLTAWFTREEFVGAKERLDRLRAPYYVTRGNHDRVEANPEDYFKSVFGLESSWRSFDASGFHFILLDDNRLDDGWHGFPEEEFAWFEQDLKDHAETPTFIFCHRPLASPSSDLNPALRTRLLDIIAQSPQIAGVVNGHSHQAHVRSAAGVTAPFIEVPAVKEYPVGYGLVRIYRGGFIYTFHFADCPDCREWNHITRGEYFGRAPQVLFNELSDRCRSFAFPPEIQAGIAP